MKIEPVVLEGTGVRLVPLTREHHAALCNVGLDPKIWRWTTTPMQSPEDMRQYVETALRWQSEGTALPFATEDKSRGLIVGSTRFANIDRAHRRAEIGWTWIAPPWQRTRVNTEAKYLMLRHAFDVWKCVRVEFKTDSLNEPSRKAILRLGAIEEGILRNHMIVASGRRRHSVYFSIIDSEWSRVRSRLEDLLARGSEGSPIDQPRV